MDRRLGWPATGLLLGYSLLQFGVTLVGGRVLTMHESRLPQAAREMYEAGEWIVPTCGGRPWLERPPVPHWLTIAVASVVGRCDETWIVRIPNVLVGLLGVWLVAWVAARWYGRDLGLLSGLIFATMFEYTRYAWLAEEDVYVATSVLAVQAVFLHLEFFRADRPAAEPNRFFGGRPWPVLLCFVLLGLTNMVKGLLFGAAIALVPIVAYFAGCAEWQRVRRYLWFWGWLAAGVTAVAWIAAASLRHPEFLELWTKDVTNRTEGIKWSEPFWYYWAHLPVMLAPWTPAALLGLWQLREKARRDPRSPERFLWSWTLLPVLALSIPAHKHHHYLVPCLAPWAIVAAHGAAAIRRHILTWPAFWRHPAWPVLGVAAPGVMAAWIFHDRIPGPAWLVPMLGVVLPLAVGLLSWSLSQRDGRRTAVCVFSLIGGAYLAGHVYTGQYLDTYRADSEFLARVRRTVPADQPIFVNAHHASLNMFRHMFYLGENARMLHNLSFLRDDRIREPSVHVIARYSDGPLLAELGACEVVDESAFHQRRDPPDSRWALFRVTYAPGTPRYSAAGVTYTALQVMEREPGPYLGTKLE